MSRITLAFSIVAALSSAVSAAAPSFAQPPPASPMVSAYTPMYAVAPSRADVRAMLVQNRAANLARFRAYLDKKSYPSNVYTNSSLNVWRDVEGRFCAAATIIRASGETALVNQIAKQDNFIRLGDVTGGPMLDSILTSGLTQDELSLIQRPFMPVGERPTMAVPETVTISASLRIKETARLAKAYREIHATLLKNKNQSLDAAVDRLMREPALASKLVHGVS